jgi:hypothetical protein
MFPVVETAPQSFAFCLVYSILCSFGSGLLFFTMANISLFDLISLFNLVIGLSVS